MAGESEKSLERTALPEVRCPECGGRAALATGWDHGTEPPVGLVVYRCRECALIFGPGAPLPLEGQIELTGDGSCPCCKRPWVGSPDRRRGEGER
jgi:DNA-directed RNA polymerase subunit RPC12/RpoP